MASSRLSFEDNIKIYLRGISHGDMNSDEKKQQCLAVKFYKHCN
jgi:hypothetical protein